MALNNTQFADQFATLIAEFHAETRTEAELETALIALLDQWDGPQGYLSNAVLAQRVVSVLARLDGIILSNGVPGAAVGAVGAYAFDTQGKAFYGPKTESGWGAPSEILQGPQGDPGEEIGLQVTATHIQWRLGAAAWQNLIALSALTGPAGSDGADGRTVHNGSGVPSSGLGENGDFYIDTFNVDLYGPKTAGAWGSGVSLIGPPGEQGLTGDPGADGANGRTVLHGSGAPSDAIGIDGDFYIDTVETDLYGPKAAGAWPAAKALVGPQGPQGNGLDINAAGPFSERTTHDGAVEGFVFLADDGADGLGGQAVLYVKQSATSGDWTSAVELVGPAGVDGASVLSGSGAPASALGSNGDFYIDTAVTAIYGPKASGAWGSATSLIGPSGVDGADGASGADGATILSGTGAPAPGLGVDGDHYLDLSVMDWYGPKASGAWPAAISLVGPKGDKGDPGDPGLPGADGADGRTVLNGSGAPASALGSDGDYYLDNDTQGLYGPKTAGAWGTPVSLIGPAGADGADGAAGADGRTVLSGTGAPAFGTGQDGDFYIATDTSTLYGPKAAGAWPAGVSLIGAAGSDGREVEFRTTTTHAQWRYVGEVDWTDLYALTGPVVVREAGEVLPWPGSSLPSADYAWCDGSPISRTTYADLFSAIGTIYGAGDGSTTFNLPDYRGRTLFGKDDMGGAAANRLTGDPNAGSGLAGSTLGATGGQEHYDISQAGYDPNALPSPNSGAQQLVAWIESAATEGIPTTRSNMPPGVVTNWVICLRPIRGGLQGAKGDTGEQGPVGAAGFAQAEAVQTANFNAAAGAIYPVDTDLGAITATLNSADPVGTVVRFQDATFNFGTNALTIVGDTIRGGASFICDVNGVELTLTKVGGSVGWQVFASAPLQGAA